MEYVRLGEIRKPYGLKGEVVCFSITDFASSRFKKGTTVYLHNPKTDERIKMKVKTFRDSGDYYYLGLDGITSMNEAENYRNFYVEIDKESAPLPEGYVRVSDLMGCTAIDSQSKETLGVITDVLSYAPTKTLRIHREGEKDFFVPYVKTFIGEEDFEKKTIEIHVVEGML